MSKEAVKKARPEIMSRMILALMTYEFKDLEEEECFAAFHTAALELFIESNKELGREPSEIKAYAMTTINDLLNEKETS